MWERITSIDGRVWFGCALVLSAAGYTGSDSSPLPWLIPHALILAGIWRGSRHAWALLVTVTSVFTSLILIFGLASLVLEGFFVHISWWGPLAHGAALLALVAFRGSRLRGIRNAATHPEHKPAPA